MTTLETGNHTHTTIAIGSPGYMPDEQANGRPRFSSDLFALGMMCIQALTGTPPNQLPEDPRSGEVLWRHLCPEVDGQLADVLDRMVRPHFSQRFFTAQEVLDALQGLLTASLAVKTAYLSSASTAVGDDQLTVYLPQATPSQVEATYSGG